MRYVLSGGAVYQRGKFIQAEVAVEKGRVTDISPRVPYLEGDQLFNFSHCFLIPGFADVHVHLREPGFFYKESIATGTRAAARGGYAAVCAMPNLSPPPDTPLHLREEADIISRDAAVRVYPYGCVTLGQRGRGTLVDFQALAPYVIGFSDDGKGVQEEALMERAMTEIARTGRVLAAHCEDESLLRGGCIHDGAYAKAHGHKGICSQSEWGPVQRDIALAARTNCSYHVCHVSCKESVALIRQAKRAGVDITCETAPHYLLLSDQDLQEDGRFKMNPPLRGEEDREALIEGLLDGTIDMIATDHAPHSTEEKAKGLEGSAMGVVGLECAFRALHTGLVQTGILTLSALVEKMSLAPRRRFGIPGGLEIGDLADIAVVNPGLTAAIDPNMFLSKGRATPFSGLITAGDIIMTMAGGNIVWMNSGK